MTAYLSQPHILVMLIASAVLLAMQVLDVITTRAVINSGYGSEGNPIAAWLFARLPQSLWWAPKLIVLPMIGANWWLLTYGGAWLYGAPALLSLMATAYAAVVYSNYRISTGRNGLF